MSGQAIEALALGSGSHLSWLWGGDEPVEAGDLIMVPVPPWQGDGQEVAMVVSLDTEYPRDRLRQVSSRASVRRIA